MLVIIGNKRKVPHLYFARSAHLRAKAARKWGPESTGSFYEVRDDESFISLKQRLLVQMFVLRWQEFWVGLELGRPIISFARLLLQANG